VLIGVAREINSRAYGVALTPASLRKLTARGRQVVLERDAGAGINMSGRSHLAAVAAKVGGAAALRYSCRDPLRLLAASSERAPLIRATGTLPAPQTHYLVVPAPA